MRKISKEKQFELKEILVSEGASKVGFADLSCISELEGKYNSGVSILVKLSPEIILKIKKGPTAQYCREYSRVNTLLDRLAGITCCFLNSSGFLAEAPKATIRTTELDGFSINIPHKTVARLSGMGWIGKSALLVTEEFGSAVRLTSVFTDAIFEYDNPLEKVRCGSCLKCRQLCPANAISGNNWSNGIDPDLFYSADLCREKIKTYLSLELPQAICGICIANCPYTQKYIKKSLSSS